MEKQSKSTLGILNRLRREDYQTKEERDVLLRDLRDARDLTLGQVGWMATAHDASVRAAGFRLLRSIKDPKTVEVLLSRWSELPPTARRWLATSFPRLGPTGWEHQLEPLFSHKSPQLRVAADEFLDQCKVTKTVARLLCGRLESDDERTRHMAMERLAEGRETVPVSVFVSQLNHPDEAIRSRVIDVLIETLGKDCLTHLTPRVEVETHRIQSRMADLIVELAVDGIDVVAPAVGLLSSGYADVRQIAARTIALLDGSSQVVQRILDTARTMVPWLQQRIHATLSDSIAESVNEYLRDASCTNRSAAVLLARWLTVDSNLQQTLQKLVSDADWKTRINAVSVLGAIGTALSVPYLVELLESKDKDTRLNAIAALVRQNDVSSFTHLSPLFSDPDVQLRSELVLGIASLATDEAYEQLEKTCAEDASVAVRNLALDVLRNRDRGADDEADDFETLSLLARKQPTAPQADSPPIEQLLAKGREIEATDIHVSTGRPPLFRVGGKLREIGGIGAFSQEDTLDQVLPILTPSELEELKARGAVETSFDVADQGRYHVHLFVHRKGINAVFHVVPNHPPTLSELGLPTPCHDVVGWHRGLVLICGPANSGKTTTLAALVNHINTVRRVHILTFEDPIGYFHHPRRAIVNQRQLRRDVEDVASGSRCAVGHAPDVIAIDELDEAKSIRAALRAAESGCLVLATVKGNGVAETTEWLLQQFDKNEQTNIRSLLADTVRVIVAQNLLPTLDSQSFVAAYEVLLGISPATELIRNGRFSLLPLLMEKGRDFGLLSRDDCLASLGESKQISPNEAYLRASHPERFEPFVDTAFLEGVLA